MNTKLVNLTPHRLVVGEGVLPSVDLPASATPARVLEKIRPHDSIRVDDREVPVVALSQEGIVENLPDPVPGVFFVVSRVTAASAVARADVLFPYGEIRDADGRIVGCCALARFEDGNDCA